MKPQLGSIQNDSLVPSGKMRPGDGLPQARAAAPQAVLSTGTRFCVALITLPPGGRIPPHRHMHRTEQWYVLQGTGLAVAGEESVLLLEESGLAIPPLTPHGIENPGRIPLLFLEIQTGDCLPVDVTEFSPGAEV